MSFFKYPSIWSAGVLQAEIGTVENVCWKSPAKITTTYLLLIYCYLNLVKFYARPLVLALNSSQIIALVFHYCCYYNLKCSQ